MSFTPIQSSDFHNKCVTELADQPTLSATALKQRFDAPARDVVAPAVNQLISDLEDTTAATSLGATAPPNRAAATTVQGVMNNISSDLDTAIGDIANLQVTEHTHTNKALLDEYTQTETDLADAVAKKHVHSNKSLLDTYTQTEADLAQAVADDHTHSNKTVLDKLSESGGDLEYDGQSIGAVKNAFKYVKVGAKTITASGGEDTYELEAGSNVTLVANETTKTVTITATGGGGGGGGDMYKSEFATNGATGVVDEAVTLSNLTASATELNKLDGVATTATELGYVHGVTSAIQTQIDGKAASSHTHTKSDITDFPTIPTVDQTYDGSSVNAQSGTAVAGAIADKADKDKIPKQITRNGVTVAAGSSFTIPASGTDATIKTTSTVIPICDTAAKYSSISVSAGVVTITMAEALSNANVGVIVLND